MTLPLPSLRAQSSLESLRILYVGEDRLFFSWLQELLPSTPSLNLKFEMIASLNWGSSAILEHTHDVFVVDCTSAKLDLDQYTSEERDSFSSVIYLTDGQEDPLSAFEKPSHLPKSELSAEMFLRSCRYLREVNISKRTAKKLAESEAKYRALVETSADLIWTVDLEGRWTFINSACRSIYGYQPEEMLGKRFTDFLPKRQIAPDMGVFKQILAGKPVRRYETQHVRKDGSEITMSFNAVPAFDANGKVIGTTGTARDITERKRAEAVLRKEKEEAQMIFDTVPALIWFKDTQNRILRINKSAAALLGLRADQIEGRLATDFFSASEAAQRFGDDLEVIASGRPKFGTVAQITTNSGVKRWISTDKVPYRDEHGEVKGIIAFSQDITERRNAEHAIKEILLGTTAMQGTASALAGEFFRRLVHHLANVLGTKFAFIGKISDENPEQVDTLAVWSEDRFAANFSYPLRGSPSETVIGKQFVFYPRDLYKLFPQDDFLQKSKDQAYMGAPIFNEEGQALGVLAVWNDDPINEPGHASTILTIFAARAGAELQRMKAESQNLKLQRQLMQSQKMEAIGQLAAGIAHDLNNALAAVVGHLELMRSNPKLSADLEHSATIALSGCERASSLIEQLLGFSRQGRYNLKQISIKKAVSDTVHFLGRVIGKEVEIVERGPSSDLMISADEGQIQQVLINLIINAKQAMPRGGQISFDFDSCVVNEVARFNPKAKAGNYVRLTVSDNGSGISSDVLDKIFEPFFTTKAESAGTGLGLSMVYGIMQSHGGWVEVASTLGKGTSFALYFPQAALQASQESGSTSCARSLTSGTILVIDDEAPLVDLSKIFLERSGSQVEGFTSAKAALEWFAANSERVELAILDMKMPEMDGSECFEKLRKINPNLKVVLLSGYMEDASVQNLIAKGALKFFQKPLRYPDLVDWIAALKLGLDKAQCG